MIIIKKNLMNLLLTGLTIVLMQGLISCKEEKPDPPIVVTANYEYLRLSPETAVNMTVTKLQGDYHYRATTTGADPYVSTAGLARANPADSVVLCFEYKSSKAVEFIQVYLSDPISEARSAKSGVVPAAPSEWKEWALTLKGPINEYSWGNAGQYLRFDFGDDPGYEIELRNIHFRGMTAAEKTEDDDRDAKITAERQFGENIRKYLDAAYTAFITEVDAGANTITVTGNYTGAGSFALCEITPYQDVTQMKTFPSIRDLSSSSFVETFDRYVERDGFNYDRTLSKWAIVRKSADGNDDALVSHARYPDNIHASQATAQEKPASKKGVGAYFNRHGNNAMRQDLDDLGITSVTINLTITNYIYGQPSGNAIEHNYGGKSYYFHRSRIEQLDAELRDCAQRNIVTAAVVLVMPVKDCLDPAIGNILQHPDYTGAHSPAYYTMPNMTTAESVNAYAAALDFFANRYCRSDKQYGRIHHWIMHNEVNIGYEWTNMGTNRNMSVYTDAYVKSMRMCHNIVQQYDRYSEVFASFTQSWTRAVGDGNNLDSYEGLKQINLINDYSSVEGDFHWALAYHAYPQIIQDPRVWNDRDATYSYATPLVTFKNLEVLDHWAKQPENKYRGVSKRTVWLSENGTGSRPPTLFASLAYTAEEEQAAGFAWAWKKLNRLDGIDAIQWHNWEDTAFEAGLNIGLRKIYPGNERKDVWYAYQAAGTANEDNVFSKYLPIIGIQNWDIIRNVY